jgi:hypothetical protein
LLESLPEIVNRVVGLRILREGVIDESAELRQLGFRSAFGAQEWVKYIALEISADICQRAAA